MKISAVINAIESYAPRAFQEKWDNSGVQIALPPGSDECTGVLLCLDVNEAVVAEAAMRGCNLIISHHPLIFKGFKSLTGATVQERAAIAAVRAGIAVYSAHTSLDSTRGGISYEMAALLGAKVTDVLQPAEGIESVVSVICPRDKADDVRMVLFNADGGAPLCADNAEAPAPVDNTACCVNTPCESEELPYSLGDDLSLDITHRALCKVETTLPAWRVAGTIASLKEIPGIDKLSYTVQPAPAGNAIGLGVFAEYDEPVCGSEFAERLHTAFGCKAIKVSAAFSPDMKIRRIALCSGAGGEFIGRAVRAGVDAYVTGDVRYHDFADAAEAGCAIFDVGHFESEQCAKSIFYRVITKKFPNFAVYYAESETNPVKYL